ncbi:Detected protein of confused Function [Hibiscus syriacus]|uniref:Detected protein of confused Function n=1 Tax=Hibiscus syriacus TaxID=106335 RepID=A0A6A2WY78_HIBSY|nr:Detected protein of confused Function [Hibiscus syriacus]
MAREVNSVPLAETTQVVSSKKKSAATTSWILIDAKGQGVILDVDNLGREKVIVLNLEVLLRDPYDENVIPIVAELKRLPQDNLTVKAKEKKKNTT